jgi:hypothetical protein
MPMKENVPSKQPKILFDQVRRDLRHSPRTA